MKIGKENCLALALFKPLHGHLHLNPLVEISGARHSVNIITTYLPSFAAKSNPRFFINSRLKYSGSLQKYCQHKKHFFCAFNFSKRDSTLSEVSRIDLHFISPCFESCCCNSSRCCTKEGGSGIRGGQVAIPSTLQHALGKGYRDR